MAREGSLTTTTGNGASFSRKHSISAARSGRTPSSRPLATRGQFGLAGALERERGKADHGAAGWSLAETGEQGIERQGEGSAGEELITIDQIEQRHRLAAQGMDDVTIVDDMAMSAVRLGPTAPQDDDGRRALKAFQPIVVEAHPRPVADPAPEPSNALRSMKALDS